MDLHFILTGEEFYYPYYLCVMSAIKTQNVDKIRLWLTTEPQDEFYFRISDLVTQEWIEIPYLHSLREKDDVFRKAHYVDYLRWKIMFEEGGLYVDLDSFCLKDLSDLLGDKELCAPMSVDKIEDNDFPFQAGVVLSKKGSPIMKSCFDYCTKVFKLSDQAWGYTGPVIMNTIIREHLDDVAIVPHQVCYPFRGGELLHEIPVTDMPEEARSLHLYQGAHNQAFMEIDEGFIEGSNKLYPQLVRETLDRKEWDTRIPLTNVPVSVAEIGEPEMDTTEVGVHLLAVAHTKTAPDPPWNCCAYTQKDYKLCKMLNPNWKVYHYGAEGSTPECSESIDVVKDQTQIEVYGDPEQYKEGFFKYDPDDKVYKEFNKNAIKEIKKRKEPGDLLLISMGNLQAPVFDAVKEDMVPVECGIGYTGIILNGKIHRVFESETWRHFSYGWMAREGDEYHPENDIVIPNYFDVSEFDFCETKSNYFLYVGRLIENKGLRIAIQICKKLGFQLKVCGQGDPEKFDLNQKFIEYRGAVSPYERNELMMGAKALFTPTKILEPFGGVAVEAMLCGTPVIASAWGAFTETVKHGETGYLCRDSAEFEWAARNIEAIKPQACRDWAEGRFSMENCAKMYSEYFVKIRND